MEEKKVFVRSLWTLLHTLALHVEKTGDKAWACDNPLRLEVGFLVESPSKDTIHFVMSFKQFRRDLKSLKSGQIQKALHSTDARGAFAKKIEADPRFRGRFLS